jgi:formate-dependent nitrite reductase membrane component NrfD
MLTAALGQIAALADKRTGIVVFFALVIRLVTLIVPLVLPFLIYTHFEMHEASFYIGFWCGCLGVYAVLIWLLLRLGQWLAVRQEALPPLRRPGTFVL